MNQYQILEGYSVEDLSKTVTKFLREGWNLYGSIVIDEGGLIYQAMTK